MREREGRGEREREREREREKNACLFESQCWTLHYREDERENEKKTTHYPHLILHVSLMLTRISALCSSGKRVSTTPYKGFASSNFLIIYSFYLYIFIKNILFVGNTSQPEASSTEL